MSFDEVKTLALQLSIKQRAELAKQLLDSTENPSPAELEELWLDEVGRRIERVKTGQSQLTSLEEALQKARAVIAQHAVR